MTNLGVLDEPFARLRAAQAKVENPFIGAGAMFLGVAEKATVGVEISASASRGHVVEGLSLDHVKESLAIGLADAVILALAGLDYLGVDVSETVRARMAEGAEIEEQAAQDEADLPDDIRDLLAQHGVTF